MANNNPFDLEGRDGGPDRAHQARVWTPEEQAEKLHGYLEITPDLWDQIRHGTHIRYYLKTGEYRSGGFVQKNPFDTKPKNSDVEKRFMKLQNGFNDKARGYASWLMAYEDTARVFVKPGAETLMMARNLETAIFGLNENIRKLADYSKKLEARLQAIERK
jgi:hypothetical protein